MRIQHEDSLFPNKNVFLRGLILVMAYSNVLHAKITYGAYAPLIRTNFTEESKSEIDQVIAEQMKMIPNRAPAELINLIEGEPAAKPEKFSYVLNENEFYPRNGSYGTTKYAKEIGNPSKHEKENKVEFYHPGKSMKENEINLDLINIPTSYVRELETTKRHESQQFLPINELTENTGKIPAPKPVENIKDVTGYILKEIPYEEVKSSSLPYFPFTIKDESVNHYYAITPDGYPVINEASPLPVQEVLPPLSKDEQHSPYHAEPTYIKGPITLLPINTNVESIPLIGSNSYTNPISNAKDILPIQVQDPVIPLINRIGENHHTHSSDKIIHGMGNDKFNEPSNLYQTLLPIRIVSKETYPPKIQDIASISFHTPIPPLQITDNKISLQTVALPITEGPYTAAVVATGPYPANVSLLNDVPVTHFSEPLPPLQNAVPTNIETSKSSTLHVPEGPYPANLPIGHPYPLAV